MIAAATDKITIEGFLEIEIYALENDGYDLIDYAEKAREVGSKLLAGLKIDLEKVFFAG